MTILKWKMRGDCLESTDGRFYMTKSVNMVRLYDARNHAAGGLAVDDWNAGKELAEKIAAPLPPSRPSTNFKRRGRLPAGATTAINRPMPPQPQVRRCVGAVRLDQNRVGVANAGGVEFTLTCASRQHAELIAKALSDGLADIDSQPEA